MKLIVGLGNPGPRYADTRHNAGFIVVDRLAKRWKTDLSHYEARFEATIGEAQRGDERVFLLKPQTYMNLSGRSVGAFVRFYKLALGDLLIVYDEMDLPIGRIRVRSAGSAGGHNGMSDLIRNLSTDVISRIRVGIGRPQPAAGVDHVLSKFDERDRAAVNAAVDCAADAAECWVTSGIETTMNRYNRRENNGGGAEK